MTIMDKFGLSSPTRAAATIRYRPSASTTLASPSHLHHLLRSHSNTSAAAAAAAADGGAYMRAEKREDGDGRSCDSISTCVVGLTAVSETSTQSATTTSTTATTAAKQQTMPHHLHAHHQHHGTAMESDDDDLSLIHI